MQISNVFQVEYYFKTTNDTAYYRISCQMDIIIQNSNGLQSTHENNKFQLLIKCLLMHFNLPWDKKCTCWCGYNNHTQVALLKRMLSLRQQQYWNKSVKQMIQKIDMWMMISLCRRTLINDIDHGYTTIMKLIEHNRFLWYHYFHVSI